MMVSQLAKANTAEAAAQMVASVMKAAKTDAALAGNSEDDELVRMFHCALCLDGLLCMRCSPDGALARVAIAAGTASAGGGSCCSKWWEERLALGDPIEGEDAVAATAHSIIAAASRIYETGLLL